MDLLDMSLGLLDGCWLPVDDRPEPWNGPAVWEGLFEAAGGDRDATAVAYWEWPQLHKVMKQARQVIEREVGETLEAWSESPELTWSEVQRVLSASGGPLVPAQVTLRPWCDPKLRSTCSIPGVPLGAVANWLLLAPKEQLSQRLGRVDMLRNSIPWDLLATVDPLISDKPTPEGVRELRDALYGFHKLRGRLLEPDGSSAGTVRHAAASFGDVSCADLTKVLGAHIAAAEEDAPR